VNRMLRTPCTILRRRESGEDKYGNPTAEPVEVEAVCSLQQIRRSEHVNAGELSDTLWDLFLPIDIEIGTGDAVKVSGFSYELVGEPWRAEEGSRSLWHIEATVRRTSGVGDA
jgi:hypothetical protein